MLLIIIIIKGVIRQQISQCLVGSNGLFPYELKNSVLVTHQMDRHFLQIGVATEPIVLKVTWI